MEISQNFVAFSEYMNFTTKSSIYFSEKNCAANYVVSLEVYDGFNGLKDFEAMKAGKSATQPWLSCQYNKNTLVDHPSSVCTTYK